MHWRILFFVNTLFLYIQFKTPMVVPSSSSSSERESVGLSFFKVFLPVVEKLIRLTLKYDSPYYQSLGETMHIFGNYYIFFFSA